MPDPDITTLTERSAVEFESALRGIAAAFTEGDPKKEHSAMSRLADVIAASQALADLIGRRWLLQRVDRLARRPQPSTPAVFSAPKGRTPVVPEVPFQEAVDAILAREPRLARSAREVARVYSFEHGFALARSASLSVTKRVQTIIADAIKKGKPFPSVAEVLTKIGPFTTAYAQTVYRTNISTAFSAGRFRQARELMREGVVGGFRYSAILDSVVRPNHRAADGLTASIDDPVWDRYSPPMGYNCRCELEPVDRLQLRRQGLLLPDGSIRRARVPPGAHPDQNFGLGRPDRMIYGA